MQAAVGRTHLSAEQRRGLEPFVPIRGLRHFHSKQRHGGQGREWKHWQRRQAGTSAAAASAAAPPAPAAPHTSNEFPDLQLEPYSPGPQQQTFDLVIAGAGPSGLAVAARVSAAGFKVLLIDPTPLVSAVEDTRREIHCAARVAMLRNRLRGGWPGGAGRHCRAAHRHCDTGTGTSPPACADGPRGLRTLQAPWINNYGVWCDEFEAMGLEDCFDVVWPRAVVHLDSSPEGAR